MKLHLISSLLVLIFVSTACMQNQSAKFPRELSFNELLEIADLENDQSIKKIESLGYKYEKDKKGEYSSVSVFAYDLGKDSTAIQRINIGHRGGKKYYSLHFYGYKGYFDRLKKECSNTGGVFIGKFTSKSNFPCEEWGFNNKTINFCELIIHGNDNYVFEILSK